MELDGYSMTGKPMSTARSTTFTYRLEFRLHRGDVARLRRGGVQRGCVARWEPEQVQRGLWMTG